MQAAWTLASAGHDVRPPSHLHDRSTRSGHEPNHCRRQCLANITETWRFRPHVDAGHADLADLSRRRLRGEACVVLVDNRESAYVSLAGASAIFPP
jgi:hypothetical protein